MLQNVIHPTPEQLSLEEVSSPMNAQMLEFCDSDFFQETMQNNNNNNNNSEVTSSSNCCYDDNSPYNTNNLPFPNDLNNNNTCQDNNNHPNTNTATNSTNNNQNNAPTTSSTTTATAANLSNTNSSNLSSILFESQDELDNDISASIDFSSSPAISVPNLFNHQFDFTSIQPHLPFSDHHVNGGFSSNYYSISPAIDQQAALVPQFMLPNSLLNSVLEEDCFSSVPNSSSSYAPHLNPSSPSCSYLGPAAPSMTTFMPMNAALSSADCSAVFGGGFYTTTTADQFQPQDQTDYQGDNGGIYCPADSLQRAFNPSDLEVFNNETKQIVGGGTTSCPPLTTELTNLEDSSFKVGKLSVEQRKEKIHRYMKKRNERNFSKKIKYACRKTLADSRPRVRGRFAKNDDFGESNRAASSNHEEDDDGDQVAVKEEEQMVNSADIFAHISGVNSFKCNYSIQSWI